MVLQQRIWTNTQDSSENNEACMNLDYSGKTSHNQSKSTKGKKCKIIKNIENMRNIKNIKRTIIIRKLIGNICRYYRMHVR
jgi:hypothetical protein